MVDGQGWLVICEYLIWWVIWIEYDGLILVIVFEWNGQCLNLLNDVVVKLDGFMWFIDLFYGILMDYEGDRVDSEIGVCYVYWVDLVSGEVIVVVIDFLKFNGLVFFLDEMYLYIVDMGVIYYVDGLVYICRFIVLLDGIFLSGGEVFVDCINGFFDGFCVDCDGWIWSFVVDGVYCLNMDGELIGKVYIFELVVNVCFGGLKLNCLFIVGMILFYFVFLNVNGVKQG